MRGTKVKRLRKLFRVLMAEHGGYVRKAVWRRFKREAR